MNEIHRIRSNISKFLTTNKIKHQDTRRDNKWSKYYQSGKWKTLRAKKYNDMPICEVCLKEGIVKQADEVHHLVPYGSGTTEQDKWRLLLDYNNLCSCCSRHHDMFHDYLRTHDFATIDDIITLDDRYKEYE